MEHRQDPTVKAVGTGEPPLEPKPIEKSSLNYNFQEFAEVLVGLHAEKFYVHAAVVRGRSSFFKAALSKA
ncbi:uncharacterized protein LTR77_007717 [Saxophila tyrrhenica]|uniref:BTB domain-containing protein n=1 Tax=Saxophila tyrrhenica TaxID=1690608 RepID=A0AAV9P6T8_9PEZI|nr:hypothetical protein LTR77_007717 [Saxophila tyrrhenica]